MPRHEPAERALGAEKRHPNLAVAALARPRGHVVEQLVGDRVVARRQHELRRRRHRPVADQPPAVLGDEIVEPDREPGRLPLAPKLLDPHAGEPHDRAVLHADQLDRLAEIVPRRRPDPHRPDCRDPPGTLRPPGPHRLAA